MIRRRSARFYEGIFADILRFLLSRKDKVGYIESFEEEFAGYIGVKYALTTCSGRTGLELILEALNLKEGDEVIFPAYTLKELILLVRKNKLNPVMVDIEPDSLNINPDLIEEKITDRTKVIIATHLFGLPCNIERILSIAERHNLKVVEDCAHSCGSEYKGKKCGSLGTAGFFSFELTKPINTFGGGAVTTNEKSLADYIAQKLEAYPFDEKKVINKIIFSCAEHGLIKSPLFPFVSFLFCFDFSARIIHRIYSFFHRKIIVGHSRFTALQAYLGLKQLWSLDKQNSIRFEKANLLKSSLQEKFLFQGDGASCERFYYLFAVRPKECLNISRARKYLFFKGIDAGIKSEITDDCSLSTGEDFPVTRSVYNSLLQLPIYDSMPVNEIKRIAKALNYAIQDKA